VSLREGETTVRHIGRIGGLALLFAGGIGAAGLGGTTMAAEPPALMNYEGVLRDPNGVPQNGDFDMTFRFFDALTGGNEILVDAHDDPNTDVTATEGLFNVTLGSGTLSDGTDVLPNDPYGSLAEVFRDFTAVYMEVQIGAETLAPRVQVVASAYAINADHLDGKDSSDFLAKDSADTSTIDAPTFLYELSNSSTDTGAGGVRIQMATGASAGSRVALDASASVDDDLSDGLKSYNYGVQARAMGRSLVSGAEVLNHGLWAAAGNPGPPGGTTGTVNNYGVYTLGRGGGNSWNYGVYASSTGTTSYSNFGTYSTASNGYHNYGVSGNANGTATGTNYGVYGSASGASAGNWAGYFAGDVRTTGALTVDGGITGSFSGVGSGLTDLNASNINSGVLTTSYGGTGIGATIPSGTLLYGQGSSAMGMLPPGGGGQFLRSTGSVLSWSALQPSDIPAGSGNYLARDAADTSTISAPGYIYSLSNTSTADGANGLNIELNSTGAAGSGIWTGLRLLTGMDDNVDDGQWVNNLGIQSITGGSSLVPGAYTSNVAIGGSASGPGIAGVTMNYGLTGNAVGAGNAKNYGVKGSALGATSDHNYGVYGQGSNSSLANYGVYGAAAIDGAGINYAVYGRASNAIGTAWAGWFDGDVRVTNDLIVDGSIAGDGSLLTGVTATNADQLDSLDSTSFLRSDAADTASGRLTFTGTPVGASVGSGPIYINPATATANYTLFGAAVGGIERVRIDEDGDAFLAGDLTLGGDDLFFGGGSVMDGSSTRMWIHGNSDIDDLLLYAGNTNDDGALSIYGNSTFEMRSGDGLFTFVNGSTAVERARIDGSGNLQIDGDLTITGGDIVGGTLRLNLNDGSDFIIGNGTSVVPDVDVEIGAGGVCIDFDGSCVPPADGTIRALSYLSGSSDLAEVYPSDEVLEPGDLVVLDRRSDGKVRRSTSAYEHGVISVVSSMPGFVLGMPSDEEMGSMGIDPEQGGTLDEMARRARTYPVVLMGRVPVKVSDENGPVERGDLLTSSSQPGVAMRTTRPGSVLGQALEGWPGPGTGMISVLVMPSWSGSAATAGGAVPAGAEAVTAGVTTPGTGVATGTRATVPDSAPGGPLVVDDRGNVYARSFRPGSPDLAGSLPVSESVELGDVVVADRESPGRMRLARMDADPAVVGIVSGEPGVLLGSPERSPVPSDEEGESEDPAVGARAPVAFSGVVVCKVDAGYGEIQVGDLLTASATPGHAKRADDPQLGTIVGKALEPLDDGIGTIKVLVMLR
jgi:hypothetical protein